MMRFMTMLKACHDGPCGGHFAAKRTRHKILRMGYYWPNIFQDAKNYVQACDSCQRMGQPTHRDEMPLYIQVALEPFEIWAIGFCRTYSSTFQSESLYIGLYILHDQVGGGKRTYQSIRRGCFSILV
jgi:hypothetical protein